MSVIELNSNVFAVCKNADDAPIVALYGSASGPVFWQKMLGSIGDRMVYTPNLPGYGRAPVRGATIAEQAAEMIDFIEDLLEPVHLVGHSFGGALALHAARTKPHLIKSLTLFEPVVAHLMRQGTEEDRALYSGFETVGHHMVATDATQTLDQGIGQFVDYWNGNGTWAALDADKQRGIQSMAQTVLTHFLSIEKETWGLGACRTMTAPVQLVYGEASKPIAQRVCALLAEVIPYAQLTTIKDAGHLLPNTHAEDCKTVLMDFMETASDIRFQVNVA